MHIFRQGWNRFSITSGRILDGSDVKIRLVARDATIRIDCLAGISVSGKNIYLFHLLKYTVSAGSKIEFPGLDGDTVLVIVQLFLE